MNEKDLKALHYLLVELQEEISQNSAEKEKIICKAKNLVVELRYLYKRNPYIA